VKGKIRESGKKEKEKIQNNKKQNKTNLITMK